MVKPLQVASLDEDVRSTIWNVLTMLIWNKRQTYHQAIDKLMRDIWCHHRRRPIDTMPPFMAYEGWFGETAYDVLRDMVINHPWNDVLDLVEFIVKSWRADSKGLADAMNACFERESAPYRFVGSMLTPISSEVEMNEVEGAMERGTNDVKRHLEQALTHLSDRKSPDFRNSIKESISAVEGAAQAVAGKPGATLNECLRKIKLHKQIHPAYETALIKLYSYTSDAGGIRHALTGDGMVPTRADAQFMLVSCSAFTNYLWTLAADLNIKVE